MKESTQKTFSEYIPQPILATVYDKADILDNFKKLCEASKDQITKCIEDLNQAQEEFNNQFREQLFNDIDSHYKAYLNLIGKQQANIEKLSLQIDQKQKELAGI